MLILLDIGNTSVTFGTYHGGRFRSFGSTNHDGIPLLVNNCIKSGAKNEKIYIVASSVVPEISRKINKMKKRYPLLKVLLAGKNMPVKMAHKYKRRNQLGIDRLVNAYGASRIYKPPFLLIDFGTAVTFDYVSRKGVFEGGLIIPGPEISFQSLLKRAVRIPNSLPFPRTKGPFLGRTTCDCVRSGILEGYGAMTDELVLRFRNRFGSNLRVIATGGFVTSIKPFTRHLGTIDERHSIKSLLVVFKDFMAGQK